MKEAWFFQGRQLLRSAEVLLEQLWGYKKRAEPLLQGNRSFKPGDPDSEIIDRSLMEPVISMLVAYALENFLKGLWVFQNPAKVRSATNLPRELTQDSGHDLNKLCAINGLTTTPAEQEVLRVLSEFSRWRGRYVIERNAERNSHAWEKAANLHLISAKYPGPVEWPDEVTSVMKKIAANVKEQKLTPGV